MKILIAASLLFSTLSPAFAVVAVDAAPALATRYTCEGRPLSRIASRTEPAPIKQRVEPAPCCTGMFGCPQILANTGLVKPKRSNRT